MHHFPLTLQRKIFKRKLQAECDLENKQPLRTVRRSTAVRAAYPPPPAAGPLRAEPARPHRAQTGLGSGGAQPAPVPARPGPARRSLPLDVAGTLPSAMLAASAALPRLRAGGGERGGRRPGRGVSGHGGAPGLEPEPEPGGGSGGHRGEPLWGFGAPLAGCWAGSPPVVL